MSQPANPVRFPLRSTGLPRMITVKVYLVDAVGEHAEVARTVLASVPVPSGCDLAIGIGVVELELPAWAVQAGGHVGEGATLDDALGQLRARAGIASDERFGYGILRRPAR